MQLPRILFVLGKGGVGRSTVAAAAGACFAERGENTLIVEWALADPIGPWFSRPAAGHEARMLAPRLWAMNFSLDETLREYFVGHLHLRLLHDLVIASPHVRRLVHAGPGVAELLFCGRLFWLLDLARAEAGLDYDRIVVDAPATGHGVSLFEVPRMMASFDAAGLFRLERERVQRMFADPALTGAVVVALAEELAIEETVELLPRIACHLGRPPLALFVNRSVDRFFSGNPSPAWLAEDADAARDVYQELLLRKQRERVLRAAGPNTFSLDEELLARGVVAPFEMVRDLSSALESCLPR